MISEGQVGTAVSDTYLHCAIATEGVSGLEVDNCEISYWMYAGVAFYNGSGTYTGYNIHHNYIHSFAYGSQGYGYGIMVNHGGTIADPVRIYGNKFNRMRHSIIFEGCSDEVGEVSYNTYGSIGYNPQMDVHHDCGASGAGGGVSGKYFNVHHNTWLYSGSAAWAIYGTPTQGIWIHQNILLNPVWALGGTTNITMEDNKNGNTGAIISGGWWY